VLRQRITEAGPRTVPALLVENLRSFRVIRGFSSTPPSSRGLSVAGVVAARERVNRAADTPANRATKEAIGLLETALAQGTDLRALTLFHLLEPVRASRALGAQPAGLLRQLVSAGLERDEACPLVVSLLADGPAVVVDRLAAVQQLLDARLVERHFPGLKRRDLLWDHVTDDDRMAELGEASAGDEAGVARPEDCHPRAHRFFPGRGLRPFAIATIVSFDIDSSSVFITQYEAPLARRTTMCRCGPLK